MKFTEALGWLHKGFRITRNKWNNTYLTKHPMTPYIEVVNGTKKSKFLPHVEDISAIDWEIFYRAKTKRSYETT